MTTNAEMSYFIHTTPRHTAFASENLSVLFDNATAFGAMCSYPVPRTADLLSHSYLVAVLPGIKAVPVTNSICRKGWKKALICNRYGDLSGVCPPIDIFTHPHATTGFGGFGGPQMCCEEVVGDDPCTDIDDCSNGESWVKWVNYTAQVLVQEYGMTMGGQCVDKSVSDFLHCRYELWGRAGAKLHEAQGVFYSHEEQVAASSCQQEYIIELPFHYADAISEALPLVTVPFNTIKVYVKFAPLIDMIQVSDCNIDVHKIDDSPLVNQDLYAYVINSYVYLSAPEREWFADRSYQTIVRQTQSDTYSGTGASQDFDVRMSFPVREFHFLIRRQKAIDQNYHFDLSGYNGTDPISSAELTFNGATRFYESAKMMRLINNERYHTSVPETHIYTMSFAIDPEKVGPSGSVNLSRLDRVRIRFNLDPRLASEPMVFTIIANSLNVMSYEGGSAGLLLSN